MTADPREEIVEHLKALRAFAVSLSANGSLADDLVQDTLIKAWTNFEKFEKGTNMRAWLFTILRNTFYSFRRKHKREVLDGDGIYAAKQAAKPDHDGRLQLREFAHAFKDLNVHQREALILVGASGFSYEEAAELCGVATGTIKSRANRGRKILAEKLDLKSSEDFDLTDPATRAVLSSRGTTAA